MIRLLWVPTLITWGLLAAIAVLWLRPAPVRAQWEAREVPWNEREYWNEIGGPNYAYPARGYGVCEPAHCIGAMCRMCP
jgi:hypothetical protein